MPKPCRYKQAFVRDALGFPAEEDKGEREYWKALDLMMETAIKALVEHYGKDESGVKLDIADWTDITDC